jgi:hypothetical protein
VGIVDELVNGQEFYGGNAETGKVFDGCGMGKSGVGPPDLFGDIRVAGCKTLHMNFIDDGFVKGSSQAVCRFPSRKRD